MGRNPDSLGGPRRALAGLACAALACSIWSFASTPASSEDETPPIVRRAVSEYATQTRGNLAFTRHLTFSGRIGPMKKEVTNEVGILMRDGSYVKTKYYSGQTNGQSDSEADLRKQEQHANDELAAGRGFFKRPIDPRYVEDYRFETTTCDDCRHEAQAVRFTSLVRDEQHGDGILLVDKTSARTYSIDYDMNRAPEHASTGHAVETYGEATTGVWTCLKAEESYKGHLGVVGGGATLSYTYDHFRRFAQADAAVAAIDGHTY
jgi:hypothetical protein